MEAPRNGLPLECEKCGEPFMDKEILERTVRVEIEGFVKRWTIEGRDYVGFTSGPSIPTKYVTELGLAPKTITVVCECGARYEVNTRLIEVDWRTPWKGSR